MLGSLEVWLAAGGALWESAEDCAHIGKAIAEANTVIANWRGNEPEIRFFLIIWILPS